MKIKVTSPESAIDEYREKIQKAREGFIADLDKALRTTQVDFDVEKDNREPDDQLRDFRGAAVDELQRVLGEAAIEESKTKHALFTKD